MRIIDIEGLLELLKVMHFILFQNKLQQIKVV